MPGMMISDTELKEFCRWYADFHGMVEIIPTVLETCLCGYFKTYSKQAAKLMTRCQRLEIVQPQGERLTIIV